MKKLITLIGLGFTLSFTSNAQQLQAISTNTVDFRCYTLLTTAADVKQVVVSTAAAGGVNVQMFDNALLTAPYYGTNITNGIYVSRGTYTTNVNMSWTNFDGAISTFTNTGIVTYNITNAGATNVLAPRAVFVQAANTVGTYNTDITFTRGITLWVSTNASIVLYYTR